MDILNAPFIIAILLALTVHEWAHAIVADRLGDPTPRAAGRLTLNPVAHLDPLGTLMFFLVHFGWGKPVPIDPRYFKKYRRDTAFVSIAGPLSNLVLAVIAFFLLLWTAPEVIGGDATNLLFTQGVGDRLHAFFIDLLSMSLFINLGLMAFNLLPIAPLDGSKIVQAFVPARYERQYEEFMAKGMWILLGLLVLERALNIPILVTWITAIVNVVLHVLMLFVR